MKKEKYIICRKSTKNPNKVTAYVVFIPLPDGTKYNKNFPVKYYKTEGACKRAAVKHRDEVLGKMALNKRVMAEKSIPTVDQLFEKVPELLKKRKSSERKYQMEYRKWIKPKYGDKRITEISKLDVAKTLNDCSACCVRQTVSNVKTIWKQIYKVAVDGMGMDIKDCSEVDMPTCDKVTKRSQEEWNISQSLFNDFCEFMADYGHYMPNEKALIYNREIMLDTLKISRLIGVRPMEVRAICRSAVDFRDLTYNDEKLGEKKTVKGARIAIMQAVGSSSEKLVTIRPTKTSFSPRFVYLGEEGANLLRNILAYSKYDLVFADYDGKPISATKMADYIGRVRKAWQKKTGHTEDIYAELMRKSLSSDGYRKKDSPSVIKKQMGHKTEDMSLNWYAMAPDQDVVDAFLNRQYKE